MFRQEIVLCPDVTVAENIFVASTIISRSFMMDYPSLHREAAGILGQLGDICPTTMVRDLAIIYVSHRMVEIFDNCDRVMVFRDGRYVTTRNVSDICPGDVVNAMVGRVIDDLYPAKQEQNDKPRDVILEVSNLSDGDRFFDISFQLNRGEIPGGWRADRRGPQ